MTKQASIFEEPKGKEAGANFSNCRNYRYLLWRIWDPSKPKAMIIGLNPSTANENEDDATIQSVQRICEFNGYGGFYMTNCWAYISTDPTLLKHNPVSDEWNNNVLTETARDCKDVIFAWGSFDIVKEKGRDKELIQMFPNALSFGVNKNGSPRHPLYMPKNTVFKKFNTSNHTHTQ